MRHRAQYVTDRNSALVDFGFTQVAAFWRGAGAASPVRGVTSARPRHFSKPMKKISRDFREFKYVKIRPRVHAEIRDTERFVEFDLFEGEKLLAAGAHLKAAGWDFAAVVHECETIVQQARQPLHIPYPSKA